MKKIRLLIFAFLWVGQAWGADLTDDLLLYWSFNNPATAPNLLAPSIVPQGFSGGGLQLDGRDFRMALEAPINAQRAFTVIFWFRPLSVNQSADLLCLYDNNDEAVLSFSFERQSIACTVRGTKLAHYPYMVLGGGWAMVSLEFDGAFFHQTLYSDQITSTSHFKVDGFQLGQISELRLGSRGAKAFRGMLDELMFYGRRVPSTQLEQFYGGVLPAENSAKPARPNQLVVSQQLSKVAVSAQSNVLVDADLGELEVTEPKLILEIENWRDLRGKFHVYFDGTRIVNGDLELPGVPMLSFEPGRVHDLSFVPIEGKATDAELYAVLWNGPNEVERMGGKLLATAKSHIHLVYKPANGPITEIQHVVEVGHRNLAIEIWDDKLVDGDYISVYCNSEKLIDYQQVETEPIQVEFMVEVDKKNIITFVSEDTGKFGNNSARVRIYEDGKPVDEFSFTTSSRKKAGLLVQFKQGELKN